MIQIGLDAAVRLRIDSNKSPLPPSQDLIISDPAGHAAESVAPHFPVSSSGSICQSTEHPDIFNGREQFSHAGLPPVLRSCLKSLPQSVTEATAGRPLALAIVLDKVSRF
jgi:hypothetical protein